MPDETNVVDVDFRPKRSLYEQVSEAMTALDELMAKSEKVHRDAKVWQAWERRRLFQRLRDLRAELKVERALQFTDEGVLEALRAVASGEPVLAGQVARELFPWGEPTHSGLVRVGKALSRLAKTGQVIQHRPADDREGRLTCRWEPTS